MLLLLRVVVEVVEFILLNNNYCCARVGRFRALVSTPLSFRLKIGFSPACGDEPQAGHHNNNNAPARDLSKLTLASGASDVSNLHNSRSFVRAKSSLVMRVLNGISIMYAGRQCDLYHVYRPSVGSLSCMTGRL